MLTDLRDRFDAVLEAVEATDGWVTDRVTPYKIILGRLGDVEAGVRQLRRRRPLDVAEVTLPSGATLRVPTPEETVRVKAYLITARNRVRDYLDVAALAERSGVEPAAQVLLDIDGWYEDQRAAVGLGGGVHDQLVRQVADPRPADTRVVDQLPRYKGLARRWHDWEDVRAACAALAAAMLDGAS